MSSTATITIAEYERMIARGDFVGPNAKRLELIRGELRMMSPIGNEHGELVTRLNEWSHDVVNRKQVRIRVQTSIEIPALDSQPEPDVVWVKGKSYASRKPHPEDVLLVIEVAGSSLAYDLGKKCQLYAEAGVRDYWAIDIFGRQAHIFRDASPSGYRTHQKRSTTEVLTPLLWDSATLELAGVFQGIG